MLSLTKHPDNVLIANMRPEKGRDVTPVYWHPTIKPELRNSVESLDYFFKNEDFRDRYELSEEEANEISYFHLGLPCYEILFYCLMCVIHPNANNNNSTNLEGVC